MNESRSVEAARTGAPPSRAGRGVGFIFFVIALIALVIAVGVIPRIKQRAALGRTQSEAAAPRRVRAATVASPSKEDSVSLPATSAPIRTTQLFAKSSGFIRRNLVEVGDAVKTGQLLAEIDARETDQELHLADARLEEAEANVGIVEGSATRNKNLATAGVVSRQQADDAKASANSAVAVVKTRRAEVERLRALRAYQKIIAPFDGVVVRRNFDPGALVGQGGSGNTPIFEVADVSALRVVIDIPQIYAQGVVAGGDTTVYLPQAPTKGEKGKIVRTSAVLDPTTRTRRTEIELPGGGSILPNAFVYVKLSLPKNVKSLIVPASALIIRKDGTQVAKLEGNVVKLVPVEISRDLGREIELSSGVALGDRVVLNPSDELATGAEVRVVEEKPNAAAP